LDRRTEIKARTARPGEKDYRLVDGGKLYLVKADGGK
jgi:hypothetical protein